MTLAPFVKIGTGFHPVIDLEKLQSHYPTLPDDAWNISSPGDLLQWENMRKKFGIEDADAVPCDIFLWGTGKPPDRRLTRVGGVPWLPTRIPWPTFGSTHGTFLCQFDFRDSKDLKGQGAGASLPGDLLLVFVAGEDSLFCGDDSELKFFWVSADESEVYSEKDVPAGVPSFNFVTAWGARFRSRDFPSQHDRAHEIPRVGPGTWNLWRLPVLWATKIGGVPFGSQTSYDEPPPDYLCQLVSIQAADTSWPWVDHEQPLSNQFGNDDGIYGDLQSLMIGDMGELTLFMRDDGTVTASGECG